MNTPQKLVDFYFDFGSPTAYLAFSQLPRICTETGAGLVVKPMLLGGVFKATGNAMAASFEPRAKTAANAAAHHHVPRAVLKCKANATQASSEKKTWVPDTRPAIQAAVSMLAG